MSSPSHENDEASSTSEPVVNGPGGSGVKSAASVNLRPPAKRPVSNAVIEISDTESDDSDVCAITSYQASADEVKRIRGGKYPMFLSCVVLIGLGGIFKFKIL